MDAVDFGVGYGLLGHLFDQHEQALMEQQDRARREQDIHVHVHTEDDKEEALLDASKGRDFVLEWDDFIGQETLKEQLRIHIESAKRRATALEHVLLAAGRPGVGKTTMARLIAKEMGTEIIMLVPPFNRESLQKAAMELWDRDVLFIDEIHKLADFGKRSAENLLHILEERRIYLETEVVELNNITVIGATTDVDKLPETIIDRFPIKPHFEEYSYGELCRIAARFLIEHNLEHIDLGLAVAMAKASRKTPRVIRELVVATRDIIVATNREPTVKELLEFKDLDPDGMGPKHREYVTGLYRFFEREDADGNIFYVAGEMSLLTMLRETKQGLHRLERELIEAGLVDRTPQGRRLTDRGEARAREWIQAGKGKR